MTASFLQDFLTLVRSHPLVLEGVAVAILFVVALLMFRRIQRIAAELERRKALGDYVRGLDEFLRGDFRDAIATLETVLERDPENVEARIALGDCYRETGDPAEAKKHHHHVYKVFGHHLARNFVSLGRDELLLRNYDRAVEAFEEAVRLVPGEPDALAGLAQAYAEGGNPVRAAQYLRELYPDGPSERMGRGRRRRAARRFTDAGNAALAEGNADGAIRFFSEALGFLATSVAARTGLVRAAHALGDSERARELVAEQMELLKELAQRDDVLFEPSGITPEAARGESGADAGGSFLPARLQDVGAVVAAVEERTARYHCTACGRLLRDYSDACPGCSSVGTIETLPVLARLYATPLPDFQAAMDEVGETTAFFLGLAHKASTGDEAALAKLKERGPSALYEVFGALPALESRRYLGMRLAELGAEAALEVRRCHAARAGRGSNSAQPHDEFAAAFYLSLGEEDVDAYLVSLGPARAAAVAHVMADPRLRPEVRDRATRDLAGRGEEALVGAVEAAADSGDPDALRRAATLVTDDHAVRNLERRYLQASLLGRLFKGARGVRRRAAADILARSGRPAARDALGRAAAGEKDAGLRAHYAAARERAGKGGAA